MCTYVYVLSLAHRRKVLWVIFNCSAACLAEISQEEIDGVGFQSASYDELAKKYDPEKLHYGYNTVDGEEIYYIPNPALGLWINREKF